MKLLIFLAAVVFFAIVQGQKTKNIPGLRGYHDHCLEDTGVDIKLIVDGRNGKYSNDEKLEKYYFCMLYKIGILDATGETQVDAVREKILAGVPTEDANRIIEACKDRKGNNKYETARLLYECCSKTSSIPLDL